MREERRGGPYRPRLEIAAAVWADAPESISDTLAAECAFEAANHRLGGIGWQIPSTILAVGPQFEHWPGPSGVATRQSIAEHADDAGFDIRLILGSIVIGQHDLTRTIQFLGRLA